MVLRLRSSIALLLGLLAFAAAPARAEWKAGAIPFCGGGALAVDSAGTSHLVCNDSHGNYDILRSATFNSLGARGPSAIIPLQGVYSGYYYVRSITIATDSRNRPHLALVVGTAYSIALDYLDIEKGHWRSQTIDTVDTVGIGAPQLTIDANDIPHIAYTAANGLLAHAYFNGGGWQIENLGVQVTPTAIEIAGDGTVHIAGLSNVANQPSQVCEERGANGSWTGECFDYPVVAPSLALAQDGSPEMVYAVDSGALTIKVVRFDGSEWTTQATFDSSASGISDFTSFASAIDSAGQVKIVLQDGSYHLQYVVEASNTWSATDLGPLPIIYGLSLQLDTIGLPHTSFSMTDYVGFQIYFALLLPDLTDNWQSVASRVMSGKTWVAGRLLVKNIGTAATAKGSTVSYYLSSDAQLDPTDTLLGTAKLAVGAGKQKVVTFKFSPATSVSGEYLIASISPANPPDETNASSTITAILIP